MSASVIPFALRARPRDVQAHAREAFKGACVKWFDPNNGTWVVDHHSADGDSVGMLGRFLDEAAADRCIAKWGADSGRDPRGAA